MARKITQLAVNAFLNSTPMRAQNMEVKINVDNEFVDMYLHNNRIARRVDIIENDLVTESALFISNAGWQTNTTKERLNALPGVSISQKKGVWYLNGKEWNGEWTKI